MAASPAPRVVATLVISLVSLILQLRPGPAAASPLTTVGGPPAGAARAFPPPSPAIPSPHPLVPPRAWVLVDADTGDVISASADHVPMPPASTTKLLTAIIAATTLAPGALVPVSPVAQGMPAESMNMKAGQVWPLSDTLHAVLMVSANDAAVALAERISGSREAFGAQMYRMAGVLGLVDHPVLQDPAGLDGQKFSVGDGNLISAYDLAIMGRAALAIPEIRQIVGLTVYRFHGVDGIDHRLRNHDALLEQYPGAIGVKLGYTAAAGDTLVAAATRGGRTMLAVVLNAAAVYADAGALLDEGFATPVQAETGLDRLPPVRLATPPPAGALAAQRATQPDRLALVASRHGQATTVGTWLAAPGAMALSGAVAALLVHRRRYRRRHLARRRLV